MKKLLSIILSLLMVFSLIPAFAISAEEAETPEAEYAEDTVAVIGTTEYKTLFGEDGALSNTESVLAGATKDVVTLVKDVKETGSATLKSDAVLDLAGHEIINYSTETVIDTNGYKLHIKNTAYQETNARAKFGYSGTLLSTKANVTMEDVYFYEKNVFPEYKAEVNMLDGVSWCAGMYWRDGNHKDLTNYDYQMGYTASGTKISDGVYEKQFIEVEYGKSYYTYCSTTLADSFAVTLIGFDENDTPLVNYGKTNVVTITNESVVKVGVNVYCTNEWKDTYKYGKLATCISKGEVTPYMHEITDLCKTVASANAFVNFTNSTPITWTMDNCVYNQTSGTASILNLAKPIKFDFWDSTFSFANFGGKNSFTINNASSSGGIYNCTFSGNNAQCVVIYSTSSEGLVLQNCTITTSGDGRTALTISGGKVTLADGTMGSTGSSNNTNISGGDVTVNGTKFNGSKTNGYVLNISTSAVVSISKATIVKGGTTIKDTTTFLNSLAEGIALYKATTLTADNILSRTANLNTLSTFYVDECQHFCTAAQNGSKVCAYCEGEVTSIYHDYSSFKYDATHHWGVCARCDEVQPKQDHAVGENGKKATCTEPAVCGVCAQNFGVELGHSFTKYEQVSTDIAGCEHNPVTKAICDNGCGEEDYDYSALVNLEVTKEAVAPTCTEEGATQEQSCTECQKVIEPAEVVDALGHDFGEVEVIEDSNYAYTGKGKHTCVRDNCGFSEEVVIPVKEFKGSTIAILGDYDNPEEYKTIQEAIDAADEGETIIVVKDGKLEGKVALDKEIVLDLAGHTLEATTDSVSFETTKNIELRSTQLGLGEVYSGIVPVAPSTDEDTYGTIADVPNGDLYVMGHYNSGAGKLEAYENRIANKKLIAVDSSRSYIFKTGCNIQYVIREFNKKGRFAKSVGAVADGATYTPSSPDVAYIGVAFWISGDNKTDILSMIQSDEFNPTIELNSIKGTVNFAKPFVKTSAQVKMSNVKAVSSANTTFVESSSADVAAPAKFVAKDCEFTASGNTIPLKFTANAMEIDVQDSSIRSTTGNGLEINSAGVFGTFKNTKITKNSGNAINISKTADAGVVFDGCSISQGGWDTTAAQVSGGKVTFTGGTSISGSNMASTVLNVSGGTVTLDGVTLSGDKGTDTNRKLIAISGSPKLIIKNADFKTGTANGARGVITNNFASFTASLAEGSAFFNSTEKDANTVVYASSVTSSLRNIYVGECGHWERSVSKAETCTTAHTCNFCSMSFDALGHDYSAYDNDETSHWRICSRCKMVDPVDNEPEAHYGGQATCDEPAECEACQEYHGEALGHLFPEANADGSYDAEDYAYDETSHWICCSREGCDAAKEGTTQAHSGGTAKCEEKAVCEDCGQEYGDELGHSYIRYVSDNNATCTMDGTETAYCENGCGKSVSRIEDDSKRGHNWVTDYGYAATCKDDGLTNGSHCDACGIVREEQEVIKVKPNAHTWDDGVLVQQGDCSTDTLYKYTCTNCGKEEISNLGKSADKHVFSTEFTIDTPATCTKDGSMSKHCTKCDAKTSVTVIPKGHKNTITKGAKKATYFAKGATGTVYCEDCGSLVSESKVIAKKVLKTPKFKLSSGKGKFGVKYTKVKNAKGFQVRYKLANGKWKTVKFKATKNITKFVKNLSKGKYTVQIRAYITKGKKIAYSKWTKSQKVTVK